MPHRDQTPHRDQISRTTIGEMPAIRTGEMGIASAALQHTDPRTTERHYNKGRMIEAARTLNKVLASIE